MKNKVIETIKTIILVIAILWAAVVLTDYLRFRINKDALFCIKEETKTYNDGTVHSCTGLGYKVYNYQRRSITAVEFGPFFLKEK
ncbi:MAG: hypothetical protein IJN03_02055 [Bacilli bacterium]|nr:hypothetical protein [Bacilli bacterium]